MLAVLLIRTDFVSTGVVADPSTVGRSASQGAPIVIVVGEVATPCCMHASRFSIKTPSQTCITKSLIECTILRIRSWIWSH